MKKQTKNLMAMKEPTNTLTHLAGAMLSLIGMCFMLWQGIMVGKAVYIAGALVFGLSLIALYSASTVYHWVPGSEKVTAVLRKIDHAMIYILIAGTYTPICLITLKGTLGTGLLIAVWSLAVIGIVMKIVWMHAPRWLYTGCYLFLGWLAVFFIWPIYKSMPTVGFICLLVGGGMYTIGSIIYAKKPKRLKIAMFGFHEIFHMFILAGSAFHYVMISQFVLAV